MNAAFVAVRTVHFAATMVVFGELVFATLVAGAPWRRAVAAASERHGNLERHVRVFTAWALVASALSAAAWLVIEAAQMSGATVGQALRMNTLAVVLRQTEFGHVFVLRALLFMMLAALLAVCVPATTTEAKPRRGLDVALVVAALYLAALAGAGHAAAAGEAALGAIHVGADALHLLAAGGWLGALPALVYCFAIAPSSTALARLTRRFSVLGIVCVAALIASGIVNALFLVGSFAALFGTRYGDVLVVKLALFAALLVIAAINRSRLTPHLVDADGRARRSLRRNAMLEIAGGILIVAIVGVLGTLVPGAHQSPVWPFPFALDFSLTGLTNRAIAVLYASLLVAGAALALIIGGMRRKTSRMWIAGCVALLVSAVASTSIFAVPAFPTTYAASPVPYDVHAVAAGARRFASDCSGCHGADARGNGPAAASLPIKPVNLAEHALHHPQGNLYWWTAHGIAGTPMPAFSPRLDDREIWELVQFLVARASADAATSLGSRMSGESMSRAPDFSYELPRQGQRTLYGVQAPALIVLYSLPKSGPRLAQLASDHRLMHANLRVIAMPMPGSQTTGPDGALPRAIVDPDVPSVYAMFAAVAGVEPPAHDELLVDAGGIVRARWTGLPGKEVDRDAQIAAAAQRLPAPSSSAPMHHGH
jgi:putative copper export protein/mono/diheme cytochrome c family protein